MSTEDFVARGLRSLGLDVQPIPVGATKTPDFRVSDGTQTYLLEVKDKFPVPGQPGRNTGRPTSAVAAVAASLKRFGWQQAIVADPKGVIVAGETRYKAAVLIGWTAAPVVTIPARQARAFRVIDNRTSKLTSWDTDLLPDALSGLNDLDIFSFDDVLPSTAMDGKTDPDDIPETPKNPVSRVGDIWTLGKHRLMCGDATKPEHVERLLDGVEPDLMVTDPPYGVNYDATWRYKAGVSTKDGAFGKSVNDDTNDCRPRTRSSQGGSPTSG